MIASLITWLIQTWNALALTIARDWLFYVIAVPVVATIAWFTLPCFKPPFDNKDESSD